MKLYWEERKAGQRLVLLSEDSTEVEVGAVRQTPRGFDALAKTNTYDPGRAQKGMPSMEEAKAFVEEFHPWDIFGGDLGLEVEPEVKGLPGNPSASNPGPAADAVPAQEDQPAPEAVEEAVTPADAPPQPVTSQESRSDVPPVPAPQPPEKDRPRKRWWQFGKGG